MSQFASRFSSLMGKMLPVAKSQAKMTGSWLASTAKPLAIPAGIDGTLRGYNLATEHLTNSLNAQPGQRMANDADYRTNQTNQYNANGNGVSFKDIATNPLVLGGGATLGSLMLLDYLHRKNSKNKEVTRPALENEPNTLEG